MAELYLEKKLKYYEWDVTLTRGTLMEGNKYTFSFDDNFFSNGKIAPYDFVEILADSEEEAIEKFKGFMADRTK